LIVPEHGIIGRVFVFKNYMSKTIIFSVLSLLIISLSLIDAEADESPSLIEGKKIYMHYCASCHGDQGNGKGFNAKNLDPRPADHTDLKLMSRRSDKDLSDTVSGGGRMVGKATLMPPWGEVLNKTETESLVSYMRKLCACSGSQDD
jgi:mono/diheme cytochrome c family protein